MHHVKKEGFTDKRALSLIRLERIRRIRLQRHILLWCIIGGVFCVFIGFAVLDSQKQKNPLVSIQESKIKMQKEALFVCSLLLEQKEMVLSGRKSWMKTLIDVEKNVRQNSKEYKEKGYQTDYIFFVLKDLRKYAHHLNQKEEDFVSLLKGYPILESNVVFRGNNLEKQRIIMKSYIDRGRKEVEGR